MRPVKKIILWAAGFFLVFSVAGFFIAPPVIKSTLLKKLSENLRREVSIGKIRVNPYLLSVSIKDIRIKDVSGKNTFVSLNELFINASINSVFNRAVIVEELKMSGPYVKIVRNEDETYNFSDLIPSKKAVEEKAKPVVAEKKSKSLQFSLNNIIITDGSIEFVDTQKDVRHNITDVNIAIPFVSNIKYHVNTYVQPLFSAKIDGADYVLKGKTKPFAIPREAQLDVDIKGINLKHYMTYVPVKPNFLLQSADVDISSRISFVESENKTQSLVISGDVALKNVVVDDLKKQNILRLPSFNISIASLEPIPGSLRLSKVIVSNPELTLKRNGEGVFNLATLISEKKGTPGPAADKTFGAKEAGSVKATAKAEREMPFNAFVDEFVINGGRCVFYDRGASHPVELLATDINLRGEGITTEKNKAGTIALAMHVNKKGEISAKGRVAINPLNSDLSINVNNIDIRPFQPYFTDKVKINVIGGIINTTGSVMAEHNDKTGISVKYRGDALFSNFGSVDKLNGDDFLKWKAFSFSGIKAGYNPFYMHIRGLSIADFYARVTLNQDGTLSLRKVIEEDAPRAGEQPGQEKKRAAQPTPFAEPEKTPDRDFSVGSITLQGGTIDFMDKMIKPAYSVNLTEMTGRIGGFSLNLDRRADVELRGKIDNHVPLEIVGKINPARNNLFTDISVSFKDLDLSAMTPYSGKYMGYKIEKGSLSIDLKYLIDKRRLDSENKIFIDQLMLGEKVDSPDATKLPLKLAIALLKDRNGRIELDVPVSGSLDDPKFSVFKIVIKVIVNLVVKAATAPFALLGALFGGGEELSYIEFDYGKNQLSQTAAKKIDTLAKALYERPSLKLDIEGHADAEKDKDAIKTEKFNRKIKTQKLNDIIKKGLPAMSVDEIVLEKNEYQKYLTLAYKAEKFEKPRNMLGIAKSLPTPEMEKLMYTNIIVDDGDLRTLAKQRAGRVRDGLLTTGKVTADRIFIVEPKSISPEKKEKTGNSRVDLRLK